MMIWGLLMSAGVELGVPMSMELEAPPRHYDHQFHGKVEYAWPQAEVTIGPRGNDPADTQWNTKPWS